MTTMIPTSFTGDSSRRAFLGATAVGAVGLLTGCKGNGKPASMVTCDPLPTAAVNRKFIFDRTTVPPPDLLPRLVHYLEQGLAAGDHLQVLRCGGVTASLVEEVARLQVPTSRLGAGQLERDRWSKSPDQIRRERHCEAEALRVLNLTARLSEVVADTDSALQARSPLFEAIAAAVDGWRGDSLELWSDGLEHLGVGRSFYGPQKSLQLPSPDAWIERLKAEKLLPLLAGIKVTHLAIGLNESVPNRPRVLRPYEQTKALKHVWAAYWEATGASYRFAEPLPVVA